MKVQTHSVLWHCHLRIIYFEYKVNRSYFLQLAMLHKYFKIIVTMPNLFLINSSLKEYIKSNLRC